MFKKYLLLFMLLPAFCYSQNTGSKTTVEKVTIDTLRIHPIGDSITRGKAGDTYRQYLRKRIKSEMQMEVDFVGSCPHAPDSNADWATYPAVADSLEHDLEHDGWGGFKIHEIISNTKATPPFIIEELVTNYPSDFILLMIGTNDLYFYYQIKTAHVRLDTLIKKIVNTSAAHLIVASIPPTYVESINNTFNAYNTQAKNIVDFYRLQGKKISYVDINSKMTVLDLLSDVIHPNSSGNKKIADGYFDAINEVLTGVEKDTRKSEIPSGFQLFQNYPNPFNSGTTIQFSILEPAHVSLKIYNVLGEEIMTCLSDEYTTGNYMYRLDAANLNSGLYFFRMESGSRTSVNRFLLLK